MTPDILAKCLGATLAKANVHFAAFSATFDEFGITTRLRQAAFCAQCGHESGSLVYVRELWGPTAQQAKYDPPSSVATLLGNTMKGDGYLYRGRGWIQITGRANYARYGKLLGLDLLSHPELLELPANAARVSGMFWQQHALNALADAQQFDAITQKINGGQTGAVDRRARYSAALEALS